MTAAVGVLCARVRVEEKLLIAALAEAGVPAMPLPPAGAPLPVGPVPPSPLAPADGVRTRLIVDRCQDRAMAAAILPVCRALGGATLDAGLAATGDRLAVASTLAAAAVARPATRLVCSPEAALTALTEVGYPATLLSLRAGAAPAILLDRDAAEAVLEHRAVLGSSHESLALVQAGAPGNNRLVVVVAGGRAAGLIEPAAIDGWARHRVAAIELAAAAAGVLGAGFVGVEVALLAGGPVVWDVQAVPEYRHAAPLGGATVAQALARLVIGLLDDERAPDPALEREFGAGAGRGRTELFWQRSAPATVRRRGVSDGFALSA